MIIRWFFIWFVSYANTEITFGKDGLRKEILERKQSVLAYTGNKEGMIVIIK
jgi:hypothetical protein